MPARPRVCFRSADVACFSAALVLDGRRPASAAAPVDQHPRRHEPTTSRSTRWQINEPTTSQKIFTAAYPADTRYPTGTRWARVRVHFFTRLAWWVWIFVQESGMISGRVLYPNTTRPAAIPKRSYSVNSLNRAALSISCGEFSSVSVSISLHIWA